MATLEKVTDRGLFIREGDTIHFLKYSNISLKQMEGYFAILPNKGSLCHYQINNFTVEKILGCIKGVSFRESLFSKILKSEFPYIVFIYGGLLFTFFYGYWRKDLEFMCTKTQETEETEENEETEETNKLDWEEFKDRVGSTPQCFKYLLLETSKKFGPKIWSGIKYASPFIGIIVLRYFRNFRG